MMLAPGQQLAAMAPGAGAMLPPGVGDYAAMQPMPLIANAPGAVGAAGGAGGVLLAGPMQGGAAAAAAAASAAGGGAGASAAGLPYTGLVSGGYLPVGTGGGAAALPLAAMGGAGVAGGVQPLMVQQLPLGDGQPPPPELGGQAGGGGMYALDPNVVFYQ